MTRHSRRQAADILETGYSWKPSAVLIIWLQLCRQGPSGDGLLNEEAESENGRACQKKSELVSEAYRTRGGKMLVGRIEDALDGAALKAARGKVNLIFTSPPFPLVFKKRYGNETGDQYLKWLESLAPPLCDLLAPKGSIVIEIGNSWEPGVPVMSTLGLEALLAFKRHHQFFRRHVGVTAQRHIFCIRASGDQACTRGSLSDGSTGNYQPVVDL
jgi:hypothetical protein